MRRRFVTGVAPGLQNRWQALPSAVGSTPIRLRHKIQPGLTAKVNIPFEALLQRGFCMFLPDAPQDHARAARLYPRHTPLRPGFPRGPCPLNDLHQARPGLAAFWQLRPTGLWRSLFIVACSGHARLCSGCALRHHCQHTNNTDHSSLWHCKVAVFKSATTKH